MLHMSKLQELQIYKVSNIVLLSVKLKLQRHAQLLTRRYASFHSEMRRGRKFLQNVPTMGQGDRTDTGVLPR